MTLVAVLTAVRGLTPGELFLLKGERTILGRHPNCHVVVDNAAVSRHHAQILESHSVYHLEDLRSRNGTFLNGKPLEGRMQLSDNDQIRLSAEVVLTFMSSVTSEESSDTELDEEDPSTDSDILDESSDGLKVTQVTDTVMEESQVFVIPEAAYVEPPFQPQTVDEFDSHYSSDSRSGVDPETKLRAVLDIARALGGELRIDKVLPTVLEKLFGTFSQADQGFILMKEPVTGRLRVMATKSRTPTKGGDAVAVSMTVVREAMDSGKAILSANVLDDSRFKKSTSLSRMQIRSMMCVPLLDHDGEGIGVIQVVSRNPKLEFSKEDLDLLDAVAAQAALTIENAKMHEAMVAQRDLDRDLEFATQIQLGFLPKSRPRKEGYQFADYYEAAMRVGGDYFDYIELHDNRVAMAIGDVAGKGVPAALLMARLYSSTRYQLLTNSTLDSAVTGLNEEISSSGLGHRFITFLLMVLDAHTHTLTIVNAGHPAPLMRKPDGTIEPLAKESSALPLGINPEQVYSSSTILVQPGESVIAFTDGVTEAMTEEKDLYGRERLYHFLEGADDSIEKTVKGLVEDVENFAGGPNKDDTCILGFRRLPLT